MTNTSAASERTLLCGHCGHNLRGASRRCPECGQAFDPNRLTSSLIPWEYCPSLLAGIRIYVNTAVLATFHPRKIAEKVSHPVSWRAARAFRWITFILTMIPILLLWVPTRQVYLRNLSPNPGEFHQLFANIWSFSAMIAGFSIGLLAAVRITSWAFFQRRLTRELRGRAFVISHYACASLPFSTWLAAIILLAVGSDLTGSSEQLGRIVVHAIHTSPDLIPKLWAIILLPWLYSALFMLRVATRCGIARLVVSGIALLVTWVALPLLASATMVLLLAFGYLLVRSFL